MPLSRSLPILTVTLLALAMATGLLLGSADNLPERGARILQWIAEREGFGWWFLWLALVFGVGIGILPKALPIMASGALFGLWQGTLLWITALPLAATAGFLIGRHLLSRPLREWVERRYTLAALDREMAQRGWLPVLLLWLSPLVPFTLISYAFGLSRIRFRAYLGATVGSFPTAFAYCQAGSAAGDLVTLLARPAPMDGTAQLLSLALLGLAATLAVVAGILFIAFRRGGSRGLQPGPKPADS